jgi:hypothetical protein
VPSVHGATGCPQVIHNLWDNGGRSPAGWSADFPEPVLARENRLTVPNDSPLRRFLFGCVEAVPAGRLRTALKTSKRAR